MPNDSESRPDTGDLQSRLYLAPEVLRSMWPLAVSLLVSLAALQVHYLLFHTTVEFISIIIAMTAMVVSTTSRTFTRNHFVVYVAVVMGWSGVLDFFHVLSYTGMGLLDTVVSPDLYPATQTWVLARIIQALALMCAPLFLTRSFRIAYVHIGLGLLVALAIAWVVSGTFPKVFIPGQGLTSFKVSAEYLIMGMLFITMLLLWQRRQRTSRVVYLNIQLALGFMILTEFSFTIYVSMYGRANEVGHIFKIFSAWFVYQALIERTLIDPFSMLSRTASSYDAVPFPALVVNRAGLIQQANQAAAQFSGLRTEALIGLSVHHVFHDPASSEAVCPVCARIAMGEVAFTLEVDLRQPTRSLEYTVAPFIAGQEKDRYVQVVRDVTERKQLMAEREQLLNNLGERVKELRAQYAVSEILAKPGLDIPSLLEQVAAALPQGFLAPSEARVTILSDWGQVGDADSERATNCLRQEIQVGQKIVGEIRVFYASARSLDDEPFLSEEHELIRTVAQRISGAIERHQAAVQIRRLTYLYDMLSATNRAIVHCHSKQELLSRVYEALIQHGTFPMLYIATKTDVDAMQWRILHVHGIADDRLPQAHAMLADLQGPMATLLPDLLQGQVTWSQISRGGAHAGWLDYLIDQGITERALVPLMCEGRLVGCIALLAYEAGAFDPAQIRLLQEMAADLEFALDSMAQKERRLAAETRAEISEFRFQEVFDASPAPIQILSITQGTMRAINRAHQQWLGYELKDIATLDRWFSQVYADPPTREQLAGSWTESIAQARALKAAVRSPELRLRCKDGTERIAVGTMTLVGDDAIVAWTDLTEIRRSEQALRASEQHFRTMIEQAVTGIYVRREGRFIYVNPRYCEMLGWTREELQDQEIWNFTAKTAQNVQLITDAWNRLEAGEDRVEYTVPVRSKSGQMREFQLTARTIQWDDRPATIVMATDVTEQKRAQAQIASYVEQLEASMRGTLQAVSNMIDQRDPYTAGHERRVGLIAGAIAAAMGWSAKRCEMLELTGLVHDIGKIAVPAEILSKPGRLSSVEMDLVRVHAQVGYEILKDVPFNFPVAEIIHQHHERLDGSGYPRGLKGEQILPEARILAVADVLESISAHRPYRPALGVDAALQELERGRGNLYDVDVVDAVCRMIRDKAYVLPE